MVVLFSPLFSLFIDGSSIFPTVFPFYWWFFCFPRCFPFLLMVLLFSPLFSLFIDGSSVFPAVFPFYWWFFCFPHCFPFLLMVLLFSPLFSLFIDGSSVFPAVFPFYWWFFCFPLCFLSSHCHDPAATNNNKSTQNKNRPTSRRDRHKWWRSTHVHATRSSAVLRVPVYIHYVWQYWRLCARRDYVFLTQNSALIRKHNAKKVKVCSYVGTILAYTEILTRAIQNCSLISVNTRGWRYVVDRFLNTLPPGVQVLTLNRVCSAVSRCEFHRVWWRFVQCIKTMLSDMLRLNTNIGTFIITNSRVKEIFTAPFTFSELRFVLLIMKRENKKKKDFKRPKRVDIILWYGTKNPGVS